jgi:hypothetical protein
LQDSIVPNTHVTIVCQSAATTLSSSHSLAQAEFCNDPSDLAIDNVQALDVDMSIAERRQRREPRMPSRYKDAIPTRLMSSRNEALASSRLTEPLITPSSDSNGLQLSNLLQGVIKSPIVRFFTSRNAFGLWRQYQTEFPPLYDPEENVTLKDLTISGSPTSESYSSAPVTNDFRPYPNSSSFLLGEWYWNEGVQKSQDNFRKLLEIVGSSDFNPEDIKTTNWKKVDDQLGGEDLKWLDEDAGWIKTPITIPVPFQARTEEPGTHSYFETNLYHRSLVSVIREKLTNSQSHPHFYYEPYNVFWRGRNGAHQQVYGELYSSKAFLDAHSALLNSPSEKDCKLPRSIAALMFWSDATHLTSFGSAQIWPLYMFFGNESKYRRCKPSLYTCEHIAYFEKVKSKRESSTPNIF